ncbi:ribose-5-phosphate isomerase A [Candidatus Omnitrophota bacterium]
MEKATPPKDSAKDKIETEKRIAAKRGVKLALKKAKQYHKKTKKKLILCLGGGTNIWDHYIDEISKTMGIKKYIRFVASSDITTEKMLSNGIDCLRFETLKNDEEINLLIDGADEITEDGAGTKGGGGCETREKQAIKKAQEIWISAESKKLVLSLGDFPVPFDIEETKMEGAKQELQAMGAKSFALKKLEDDTPFRPDGGPERVIINVDFSGKNLPDLALKFDDLKEKNIIIEHGLCFTDKAPDKILIGQSSAILEIEPSKATRTLYALDGSIIIDKTTAKRLINSKLEKIAKELNLPMPIAEEEIEAAIDPAVKAFNEWGNFNIIYKPPIAGEDNYDDAALEEDIAWIEMLDVFDFGARLEQLIAWEDYRIPSPPISPGKIIIVTPKITATFLNSLQSGINSVEYKEVDAWVSHKVALGQLGEFLSGIANFFKNLKPGHRRAL